MGGHLTLCGAGNNGGGAAAHNPPGTPLFLEKFDTAVGYDLGGWTEVLAGGILNEDYTSVILDGTQSLRVVTSGGATFVQRNVTAISDIWLFFQFQAVSLSVGEKSVIEVQSNTSTMLGKVTVTSSAFRVYVGSSPITLLGTVSTGVKYNCWFEYNKNNGSNRIATFGYSTTTTRPTSGNNFGQSTAAPDGTDVSIVAVGVGGTDFGADVEFIYDYVLGDDAQIGDNP